MASRNEIKVVIGADGARLERELKKANVAVEKFSQAGEAASAGIGSAFSGLAGLIGSAFAVSSLVKTADAYTMIEGRLKLVTSSAAELAAVQSEIYTISQETRSSYTETAGVYSRFAQATKDIGMGQHELLEMTKTLNQAFVVSGASTAEASAAMLQLSQAFSSGVLRGEEFNSISEQGGRIIQMLTDHLGVSRGELRAMAKDGKLTADVLRDAIGAGAEKVNAEFGKMSPTVGQSMQVLQNAFGSVVDWANDSTGATKGLAATIIDFAGVVEDIPQSFSGALEAVKKYNDDLIALAGLLGAAKLAQLALNLAVKASPYGLAATALVILNEALREFDLNIGSINSKWKAYDQSMGILTGRLDEFGNKIDPQKKRIADLKAEIELLNNSISAGTTAGKGKKWYEFRFFDDPQAEKQHIADVVEKIKTLSAELVGLEEAATKGEKDKEAAVAAVIKEIQKKKLITTTADEDESIAAKAEAASKAARLKAEKEAYAFRMAALEETQRKEQLQVGIVDQIIAAEEELKMAMMSESEQRIYAIEQEYDGYQKLIDQIVAAGDATEEWGVKSRAILGVRMQEDLEALEALKNKGEDTADRMKDAFTGWANNMASSLNDVLWSADATFGSIAESFAKMITQMIIQIRIIEPLLNSVVQKGGVWDMVASSIGGLFGSGVASGTMSTTEAYNNTSSAWDASRFSLNAKGNVFSTSGLAAYENSVVFRPTIFPFARGIGLMGEAGAEAIVPLTRMNNGDLGVKAMGGGNVTVNVINNSANSTATTSERSDGRGSRIIDVMIDQIKSSIAGDITRGDGAVPTAMAGTYGLNRVAGAY